MPQVFLGLAAEGSTDYDFFIPLIEKIASHLVCSSFEQALDITVYPVDYDKKGLSFPNAILNAAKRADEIGIDILIIHADSDALSSSGAFSHRITPAFSHVLAQTSNDCCQNLVPLVPIYETEAWLLADAPTFLEQLPISTTMRELGLSGSPESLSNPKGRIQHAINGLAPKQRRNFDLKDLYSIIGSSLHIETLIRFSAYQAFEQSLLDAFRNLGLR